MLPDDAPFGAYQVRATLDNTVSELTVNLGEAPLPTYRVDVAADAPYYLPGDLVTGQVSAGYFFGKPVADAAVELRLLGNKLGADPAAGDQRLFVRELTGQTDAAGNFSFQFELPELGAEAFNEQGVLELALEATVTDATGDAQFGWQTLSMARQPILIDVVPEGGTLRTGVENILYVLTSYPDGAPAATALQVEIGSGAVIEEASNDYGLAEVRYTPRAGDAGERRVQVTALDTSGHAGSVIVELPLDEAQETLLLRTDRAIYQVGDTIALEAVASGSGNAVYVDVIKGGQTLLTQSALVEDGRATLALDLTPDLAGTLEINAYQVTGDGEVLRDTRVAVVDAPEDIQVAIAAGQDEYRPGQEASVSIETTRNGEPVEAAVGVSVVNEAVFAQRPYQPGFARSYFILDQALQSEGVSLPDAPLSAALGQPVAPGLAGSATTDGQGKLGALSRAELQSERAVGGRNQPRRRQLAAGRGVQPAEPADQPDADPGVDFDCVHRHSRAAAHGRAGHRGRPPAADAAGAGRGRRGAADRDATDHRPADAAEHRPVAGADRRGLAGAAGRRVVLRLA